MGVGRLCCVWWCHYQNTVCSDATLPQIVAEAGIDLGGIGIVEEWLAELW